MVRGRERPTITRSKNVGASAPIAQQIREGLEPYLEGMLKTIGQAGAGPRRRGKGSLRAATDGVKLLIDSIGKTSGDSEILNLIRELTDGTEGQLEPEEEYADDDIDEELEDLNSEIDGEFDGN